MRLRAQASAAAMLLQVNFALRQAHSFLVLTAFAWVGVDRMHALQRT
jgi:hypothetical protein